MVAMTAKVEELKFWFFSKLSHDIKMMMIERMGLNDRRRFSQSSKLSDTDSMTFKYRLRGLEFSVFDENNITVGVIHYQFEEDHFTGFRLEYIGRGDDTKWLRYFVKKEVNNGSEEEEELKWEFKLDKSINLLQASQAHFKSLGTERQDLMRILKIKVIPNELALDFGIFDLSYVEEIDISDGVNGFSKTLPIPQQPLKKLIMHGQKANESFGEKIYETSNEVDSTNMLLTYSQFLRINASQIFISLGSITVDDLFNFVTAWQGTTNTLKDNFYYFELGSSPFNRKRFFSLFKKTINEDDEISTVLIHHTQQYKYVILQSSVDFVSIFFVQTYHFSAYNYNLRRLEELSRKKRISRRPPGLIL